MHRPRPGRLSQPNHRSSRQPSLRRLLPNPNSRRCQRGRLLPGLGSWIAMKAMIPGSAFDLRKAQAAATQALIPVAATPAVILEAIPVAAVGAGIPPPGAEGEDPTEDNEIPDRTL